MNLLERVSRKWTHPMGRAHLTVGSTGASAHVEGLDGQTLAVKAHHGRPTGSPILHVAQVRLVIQQDVTAAGATERGRGTHAHTRADTHDTNTRQNTAGEEG